MNYLTQERHDELVKELSELKTKGRQKVAGRLQQAKELGDLSENFDYQEAREEQSRLEQRIIELEGLLRQSSIIKKSASTATVRIGSKVKVKKNGGDTLVYTVVGSNEAHPTEGLISNESPIGKALLGKKAGDTVKVRAPKGEIEYQIVEIE